MRPFLQWSTFQNSRNRHDLEPSRVDSLPTSVHPGSNIFRPIRDDGDSLEQENSHLSGLQPNRPVTGHFLAHLFELMQKTRWAMTLGEA